MFKHQIVGETVYNRLGQVIGKASGKLIEYIGAPIKINDKLTIQQATISPEGEPDRTVYLRHFKQMSQNTDHK